MSTYIAVLRKEPGSDYGVEFPDFPGCVTGASTQSEAMHRAVEALALHIRGMEEDGEKIPAPVSVEAFTERGGAEGGVMFFVTAPGTRKTVRINVTMDENVLEAIAAVSGNRSRFLEDAAREKLARELA